MRFAISSSKTSVPALEELAQNGAVLSAGTVYPLLARLKTDGLLDSQWVEADAGHPRKYYQLTAAGRRRGPGSPMRRLARHKVVGDFAWPLVVHERVLKPSTQM